MQTAYTKYGAIEYRLEGQGRRVALFLLGGHVNASIPLGETYFIERGFQVLNVSRPGYGKTPLSTGITPIGFADALSELLNQLGIERAVVIGISAGGRTAIRFAAKHPARVEKLVLQSSISFAPWPDRLTRLAAYIGFNPFTEKYTWKLMRAFLRRDPKSALKMMLSNMATLGATSVISALDERQMQALIGLFAQMSSGRGFLNDIKTPDTDATDVTVPTLIVHSKYDKSVPLSHARLLAQQIRNSVLYLSEAESHMLWFSPYYAEIEVVMSEFLHT